MCVCMTDLSRCGLLLLAAAAISLFSSHTVYCDGSGDADVQWQILTKLNYSSQIRLHPRLILLVTVPWSGESRSLMKGLAQAVANDEMGLGTLKLMVLYKNVERTLADALGATDGITVFYYHTSLSYRYGGRLRVQSILVSVHYVVQLSPDEKPLKTLTTAEELSVFLHSTDKAVILFDLCGWTPRLLATNESTIGNDPEEGLINRPGKGFFGADAEIENNVVEEKDNRKDMEDGMPSCGSDVGFSGTSWLNQFSTVNNSLSKEVQNVTVSAGESCSLFELQQYKVSFQKFIEVAREFFLPPEKYRYAVIHERSLLPLLNIEEPIHGFVFVQFAGCPSCSQVLKEVDDLKAILQSQPSTVSEVGDDGIDAALPTKRPSMLLFIDRSSNSVEIRRESQEALNAVRELAEHTHGQDIKRPDKTLDTYKHPKLQHFALSEKNILQDKMSITIMNEGQQVTLENLVSNLQGLMSVQEILTYALKKKAERKLSSLAKDVGFQLLSKDFAIEVVESQPSHNEDQSNLVSGETHVEDGQEGVGIHKQIPADESDRRLNVISSPSDVECTVSEDKEDDSCTFSSVVPNQGDADESDKRPNVIFSPSDVEYIVSEGKEDDDSNILSSVEPEQGDADDSDRKPNEVFSPSDVEYIVSEGKEDDNGNILSSVEPDQGDDSLSITAGRAQGWNVGETAHSGMEDNEQNTKFNISFFFLDGQYRLLETLTGGLKVPSVVIVDPISENHYLLDDQSVLSYSVLSLFVNDFLAGKLHPHRQSSDTVPSPRGAQRPPFVNQDFHETDSIPLVTTHTFSELVLGNNSDPRNSASPWDRNVLVLFSNNWCGFCQRMEFVVREVYKSVKSYAYMKTNRRKVKSVLEAEHTHDVVLKLPLIYMMDCTRNDCGFIIRPILQREVYPLLLLFPAGRKNETVSYEGDSIVSDIIKFLAAHGSHVMDLITNQDFLQDHKSVKEELETRSLHHEVLVRDLVQNAAVKYKIDAQLPSKLQEKPELSVGCVLRATEKLLDVHPFDESKILIVKVDERTGFRGLIINKHISWDSLEELGEGSFEYLKEAPLSFGGPVMMRGMPLSALTHKFIEGRSVEVMPNVYLMDQVATPSLVEDIRGGNQSVGDFWFFLGYSSWGWEQLFTEIAQGAWNVSKGDVEQLEWPWL